MIVTVQELSAFDTLFLISLKINPDNLPFVLSA